MRKVKPQEFKLSVSKGSNGYNLESSPTTNLVEIVDIGMMLLNYVKEEFEKIPKAKKITLLQFVTTLLNNEDFKEEE